MSANPNNNFTKMALRNRSIKMETSSIPRRQSLAPNAKLAGKKNERKILSIPARVLNSVRRSNVYAVNEPIRPSNDAERAAQTAHDDVLQHYNERQRPAMQFKEEECANFKKYLRMVDDVDKDMANIGGMIKLHQYCCEEFKKTGSSVFRDAANFFKNADPDCFSINNIPPIHMVFMKDEKEEGQPQGPPMLECGQVEQWFRDYYTHRDLNSKPNIQQEYDENKITKYDEIFDKLDRSSKTMATAIGYLQRYCTQMFERTEMPHFEKGIEFWKKASPFNFGRNYQLALILTEQREWAYEIVDELFKELYDKQVLRGGRRNDVY